MTAQSSAQCKISIGTASSAPPTTTANYDLDTYTEIGEITNMGEFGDQVNSIQHISLNDGRVHKYKGSYDAGDMQVECALDPSDAGQTAVKAALDDASSDDYNFKVTLNDSGGTNPTTYYFSGKVMSFRKTIGSPDAIITAAIQIGISTGVLVEAAA